MSLISDNIIPGEHGKIFGTNAKEIDDLKKIQHEILKVDGVTEVILNPQAFPREITVHTSKLVEVQSVENAALETGFHVIPKKLFKL